MQNPSQLVEVAHMVKLAFNDWTEQNGWPDQFNWSRQFSWNVSRGLTVKGQLRKIAQSILSGWRKWSN